MKKLVLLSLRYQNAVGDEIGGSMYFADGKAVFFAGTMSEQVGNVNCFNRLLELTTIRF